MISGGKKKVIRVRRKTLNNMDRKDKAKRFKDDGTVLKRIQVQRTGISKKIRWLEGNESNSPHLRGRFLDLDRDFAGGLISRICLKLRSFSFPKHSLHEYTGRALAAAHGHPLGLTQRILF